MPENVLIMILLPTAGIIVGAIVGYLLAIRRSAAAENRATRFEAVADGLGKQIDGKDAEIRRLNEQDAKKQEQLLPAESARTKAETELAEAAASIESLSRDIESTKAQIQTLADSGTVLKTTNAELNANYNASLKALAEQKQFIADANAQNGRKGGNPS